MNQLLGSSITYRIAMGPQQGRKVFTLQTLPDCRADNPLAHTVGKVARYELKTPYNDGTTHILFEPLDFIRHILVPNPCGATFGRANRLSCRFVISRLVALVPKPRVHLTRYNCVFASNSKYRALVTPAKRGKGRGVEAPDQAPVQTPAERRASMTWAKRLKRVFHIDIETCSECGGAVKVIASIEDPVVITKILTHLNRIIPVQEVACLPESRAPPQAGLFEETHHSNARLH